MHELIKEIDTDKASWLIYREERDGLKGYSFHEVLADGRLYSNQEIYTDNGINSMLIQRHQCLGLEIDNKDLI